MTSRIHAGSLRGFLEVNDGRKSPGLGIRAQEPKSQSVSSLKWGLWQIILALSISLFSLVEKNIYIHVYSIELPGP